MVPAVAQIKSGIPPVWCHAFGVSLSRTHFVFLGLARGGTDKNSILWRAGEIHARGVTEQACTTDFIGATAGTICRGSYNFGIFGNNCLNCYKMSSYLVIQRHQ